MARPSEIILQPQHLPNEIWMRILSYIPPKDKRAGYDPNPIPFYQTLSNLCRVSKQIRAMAEPLMYEEFDTRQAIPLCNFTYAIIDNPRLCSHVRELSVHLGSTERDYFRGGPKKKYWSPRPEIVADLASRAWNYGLTLVPDDTGQLILPALNDMCIKLLILKLRNLRDLTLTLGGETALEKIFLKDEDNMRYNALNLQQLCLLAQSPAGEIIRFAGLYTSPMLKKIVFSTFYSVRTSPVPLSSSLSHTLGVYIQVRHLTFWWSFLSDSDLNKLLIAFPNITSFNFFGGYDGHERDVKLFTGAEAFKALQRVRKSLRALRLCTSKCTLHGSQDRRADFRPDMKDFGALYDLQIESLYVLRERAMKIEPGKYTCNAEVAGLWKDYFPAGLVRLGIMRCYRNVETPLQELANNVQEWLPNLKHLWLNFAQNEDSPGYTDFDVDPGNPPLNVFEPILTDEMLVAQVNQDYAAKDLVELRWPAFKDGKVSVPKSFVVRDVALHAITDLLKTVEIRHLPPLWQDIVAKFNAAGVKVSIDNLNYTFNLWEQESEAQIQWKVDPNTRGYL